MNKSRFFSTFFCFILFLPFYTYCSTNEHEAFNDLTNNNSYAAFEKLMPLAKQGNALAQYMVGEMYYKGEGVTQDYTSAAKWYRKAAEQGYAPAQYSLGLMYREGRGIPQDYAEAAKWYRKAAEQGNVYACLLYTSDAA